MFVSVPMKLVFALGVALLLNQKLRGVSFYRAVYYIPTLLGGSVAIAVLWRKLFEKDGLVKRCAGGYRLHQPPQLDHQSQVCPGGR